MSFTSRLRRSTTLGTLLVVTSFGLLAAGCGDDTSGPATDSSVDSLPPVAVTEAVLIDPLEGQAMMRAGVVTVIDVRTPAEFAAGHVEGAVNLDVEGGQFSASLADLDPAATYIVYCQSGRRSALAAAAMVAAGFTEVHDMGGIQDWTAAGLPVVTG